MTVFPIYPIFSQEKTTSLLSVSPSLLPITLSPGKTYTQNIRITNTTDLPLPVQITLEPIDTPDDSTNRKAPGQSLVQWIEKLNPELIIPARETRNFTFIIRTPSKIPLGGYYGMFYIQPLFSQTKTKTDIVTRLGVLLLGSVGTPDIPLNKVQIVDPRFSQFWYENAQPNLTFLVKNTALNHFSAKPFIRIKPFMGDPFFFEFEEKFVFPGKSRRWTQSLEVVSPGIYQGTLFVAIGGGYQQTAEVSFAVFPVTKSLLLTAGLIFVVILIRKRTQIKQAIRILFKG